MGVRAIDRLDREDQRAAESGNLRVTDLTDRLFLYAGGMQAELALVPGFWSCPPNGRSYLLASRGHTVF